MAASTALGAAPAGRTSPSRPSSTTAAASGAVKIDGVDYVDLAEFGRRFDLKAAWIKTQERLVLKSETQRLEFEADTRESAINGLRVMLGEPVKLHKKALKLSRIDAEKFIGPMLRPGVGAPAAPALKLIALDAGHGGEDPGTANARLKVNEKTFALDVAQRLKKLLEAKGYAVLMTRTTDKFIELPDRPEIARRAGADLFLSLHFNAAPPQVTGVEVFSLTPQYQFSSNDPARKERDEARLANPGNANDHWNAVAGAAMHRALLRELKASDRGHKRQRWRVLRDATCPAVLIESGYLSNDAEARKIATPAYRQQIAEGIAAGVDAYAASLASSRK